MKEKVYSKQSKKFLNKMTPEIQDRIKEAIDSEKNMVKLVNVKTHKNRWRIKLEHYRVILEDKKDYWYIHTIDTKTNMKQNKNGYF